MLGSCFFSWGPLDCLFFCSTTRLMRSDARGAGEATSALTGDLAGIFGVEDAASTASLSTNALLAAACFFLRFRANAYQTTGKILSIVFLRRGKCIQPRDHGRTPRRSRSSGDVL